MRWIPLLVLMLPLGCKKDDEPAPEMVRELSGCDPLDTSNCAYPFPSSYFLADSDTETGFQLAFGETSLPINRDGVRLRPDYFNEKDGFSINSQLLFFFEDGSEQGLIGFDDLEAYTDPSVLTVLIDLDTDEIIPHFVELDRTAKDAIEAPYLLHPAIPLEFDHHYVVGLRGLVKSDGSPVTSSEGFVALRDGTTTSDWDLESRRALFDDTVFPALEAHGFARSELQLAWDFRTMSEDSALGRMIFMRDDMYQRVGDAGPDYEIVSIEDGDCATDSIARTIEGIAKVPMYTEEDYPGTILTRDEDGQPYYNGTSDAAFLVRIPCSLRDAPAPARLLQYGHGLLGSRSEARTGWLSTMANDFGWVVFAMDWTGMAEDDVPGIVLSSAQDPTDLVFLGERSLQGHVEQMAGLRMMIGSFYKDDVVAFHADGSGPCMAPDGTMDADTSDCSSVIDPTEVGYHGNSQGAIYGGAYFALSKDLDRAVLTVGGMPYSVLLQRSGDFDPYFSIFQEKYLDDRDITLIVVNMLQQLWDGAESGGYAHAMKRDPLPDTPSKEVLLQVAIGDHQVTTIGGQIAARAWGAKLLDKPYRPVFGLDAMAPGSKGSAYVEWFYPDASPEPVANLPPSGGLDPHECPRREPASQAQLKDFLETGVVNQYCEGGGPCVGITADCR